MTPSALILSRLRALVDADDRTTRELSVAAGGYPVWLERRLAAGANLRLADLDAILGALGVGADALVGAPPCPPLSATSAPPSSTEC